MKGHHETTIPREKTSIAGYSISLQHFRLEVSPRRNPMERDKGEWPAIYSGRGVFG